MASLCLNLLKNGSICYFYYFILKKVIQKMKFFGKSLARSMPTKMQNQKNEGFSY